MNKFLKYLLLVLVIFIIQITILPLKPVAGVKPDLLLILVVINGLLTGIKTGSKLGFGTGLLQDIFSTGFPGKYTFFLILIGTLMGFIEGKLFKKNYLMPIIIIFIITIIYETFLFFISAKGFFEVNFINNFKNIILPVSLYNSIVGLILYPIFCKILKLEINNYG